MAKYNNFIASSSFSSLGETGSPVTGSVTLPGSLTLTPGQEWSASINISAPNVQAMRVGITSSKMPGEEYAAPILDVTRPWNGAPGGLTTTVLAYRLNSNTVRVEVSVWNGYSNNISPIGGDEVFTVSVSRMEVPF